MRKTYQPQSRKSYVVKRAIKREPIRAIIVLFILSFVLLFSTYLVQGRTVPTLILFISGMVFLVFSLILFFKVNRCPYCGRLFTGLHWSKPDAGNCQSCGKLIQYTTSKNQPTKPTAMEIQHQQKKKKKK